MITVNLRFRHRKLARCSRHFGLAPLVAAYVGTVDDASTRGDDSGVLAVVVGH